MRDIGHDKLLTHDTGLGICPVENSNVLVIHSRRIEPVYLICHLLSFLVLILSHIKFQLVSFRLVSPESLVLSALVVLYNCICRVKDIAHGTVILLKLYHLSVRVLILKIQDVGNIRTSEFVYRLIIITHYTKVLVLGSQKLHQQKLSVVGILILIHHYVLETFLVIKEHIGIMFKQFDGLKYQVIKIHSIISLKP